MNKFATYTKEELLASLRFFAPQHEGNYALVHWVDKAAERAWIAGIFNGFHSDTLRAAYNDLQRKGVFNYRENVVPLVGEQWQHFKGGMYQIIPVPNCQIEELENVPLVAYKSLETGKEHLRTVRNFLEIVEGRGPNGEDVPRFKEHD